MVPRQNAGPVPQRVAAKSQRPPTRIQARAAILKLLRRTHRLTQHQAAAIVGVHGDTWARWERSAKSGRCAIDQMKLEGVVARIRAWARTRKDLKSKRSGPKPRRAKVRS